MFREVKACAMFSAIFENIFYVKQFLKNTSPALVDTSQIGVVPSAVEMLAADSPRHLLLISCLFL